jgi:hypothetical protein
MGLSLQFCDGNGSCIFLYMYFLNDSFLWIFVLLQRLIGLFGFAYFLPGRKIFFLNFQYKKILVSKSQNQNVDKIMDAKKSLEERDICTGV